MPISGLYKDRFVLSSSARLAPSRERYSKKHRIHTISGSTEQLTQISSVVSGLSLSNTTSLEKGLSTLKSLMSDVHGGIHIFMLAILKSSIELQLVQSR